MELNSNFNNEEIPIWEIGFGFYPGILFGVRTYIEFDCDTHVLYLPFVMIDLTIFKREE